MMIATRPRELAAAQAFAAAMAALARRRQKVLAQLACTCGDCERCR